MNVGSVVYFVKRGILSADEPITIQKLVRVGLAKKVKYGVKILGKVRVLVSQGIDQLNFPLNLEVTDASKSVIQKITELGGEVKCIYRTPLTLKAHILPEK